MSAAIDPRNVSNLLFRAREGESSPLETDSACYVHPHLVISRDPSFVQQGRGLIATADIPAGTCLFVTPPTVAADQRRVQDDFRARPRSADDEGSDALAQLAERHLLDEMRRAMRRRDYATVRSFLGLAGSAGVVGEADADAAAAATLGAVLRRNCASIDDAVLEAVRDEELLQIIRQNAFGPDFCTYDNLQALWTSDASDVDASRLLPPHLLGIYPFAAMLNHSCVPNAVRVYAGELMVVHAAQDIPAGREVVWSYLPPTLGLAQRRSILWHQHRFTCRCQRCLVEEECGAVTGNAELESAAAWNKSLIDVHALNAQQTDALTAAFEEIEMKLLGASETLLSNEAKRYLRVGYTCLYINYFNASLARLQSSSAASDDVNAVRSDLLAMATQLHFAYCACHNASTEHLSILHLCYDLLTVIHQSSTDQFKTLPKLRFWTEQLKKAHMIRYGSLGFDLESVRKCMVHSKTVLRRKNGLLTAAQYPFI